MNTIPQSSQPEKPNSEQPPDSPRQASGGASARVDHTPPPVLFRDGSLIVELPEPFDPTPVVSSSKKRHKLRGSKARHIAEMKIMDDAGNTLYRNAKTIECEVRLWLQGTTGVHDITINNDGEALMVDVENLKEFQRIPVGSQPPPHRKRPHRYTHPGFGGEGEFHIFQVEVVGKAHSGDTKGTLYKAVPEKEDKEERRFQVMIWTHPH